MAIIRGVTEVRFDAKGKRVVRVKWGSMDTDRNAWVKGPGEADVTDVVDAIHDGQVVLSMPVNERGGTAAGPRLEVTVHEHGFEGIEVEEPEQNKGRTVSDLPRF